VERGKEGVRSWVCAGYKNNHQTVDQSLRRNTI
jgi:hypothetical protein